jgi:hypothetical protein
MNGSNVGPARANTAARARCAGVMKLATGLPGCPAAQAICYFVHAKIRFSNPDASQPTLLSNKRFAKGFVLQVA